MSKGISIFEYSRVESLEDLGSQIRIRTSNSFLIAEKVILGTSAYTHLLLPRVSWRFIPLYDYIIASEPLTDAQLESIGWKNRQGVSDGHNFFCITV